MNLTYRFRHIVPALALGTLAYFSGPLNAVESYTIRSLPVPAGIDPATTTDHFAEAMSRDGAWVVYCWEVAEVNRSFIWSRADNSLTELVLPTGFDGFEPQYVDSDGVVYGQLEKADPSHNADFIEAWPAKASKVSPTVVKFGTVQGLFAGVGANGVMYGGYQPGAIGSDWWATLKACTWQRPPPLPRPG